MDVSGPPLHDMIMWPLTNFPASLPGGIPTSSIPHPHLPPQQPDQSRDKRQVDDSSSVEQLNHNNTHYGASTRSAAAREFHLFPLLPPELRAKIWECVDAPTRFLTLTACPTCLLSQELAMEQAGYSSSASSLPAHLQTGDAGASNLASRLSPPSSRPATPEEARESAMAAIHHAAQACSADPLGLHGRRGADFVWTVQPARFAVPPVLHACRESRHAWTRMGRYEALPRGGRGVKVPPYRRGMDAGPFSAIDATDEDYFDVAIRGVPFVSYEDDIFVLAPLTVDVSSVGAAAVGGATVPYGGMTAARAWSLAGGGYGLGGLPGGGGGAVVGGFGGPPGRAPGAGGFLPGRTTAVVSADPFWGWDRSRIRHVGWFEDAVFHRSVGTLEMLTLNGLVPADGLGRRSRWGNLPQPWLNRSSPSNTAATATTPPSQQTPDYSGRGRILPSVETLTLLSTRGAGATLGLDRVGTLLPQARAQGRWTDPWQLAPLVGLANSPRDANLAVVDVPPGATELEAAPPVGSRANKAGGACGLDDDDDGPVPRGAVLPAQLVRWLAWHALEGMRANPRGFFRLPAELRGPPPRRVETGAGSKDDGAATTAATTPQPQSFDECPCGSFSGTTAGPGGACARGGSCPLKVRRMMVVVCGQEEGGS